MIIAIIIIRVLHIGEETLAYGIISIIGYVIFLVWAQATAPEGPKTVVPIGRPSLLAATLIMAYSIHDFMVQNIIKNPRRNEYQSVVKYTFIIGTLVYAFITLGSFGTDQFN